MKRFLVLTIILCACVLSGCQQDNAAQSKVFFYYPVKEYTYGQNQSIIGQEDRDTVQRETDLKAQLNEYLLGPEDSALRSPFPSGTTVIRCSEANGSLYLILSDKFAQLHGTDLTVACACIYKTTTKLQDVNKLVICAQTLQLDGKDSVIMDANCISWIDRITTNITSPEETEAIS